jgi:hypothetical protein
MVASEGGDIGIGVVVHVEGWEVAVPEVVHEKVDEPLPGRRRSRRDCLDIDVVLFGLGLDNSAVLVLTQAEGETDLVRGFPLVEGLYDEWTSEVDEGFASRLNVAIEEAAELMVDKIGHAHFVVVDVVVHHAQDHHAQSAFIVETVGLVVAGRLNEISVCARGVHLANAGIDGLELLLPARGFRHFHDAAQSLLTVDCSRLLFVRHQLQIRMQSLHCKVDLCSNREGMAGASLGIRMPHFIEFYPHIGQQIVFAGHCRHEGEQQQCLKGRKAHGNRIYNGAINICRTHFGLDSGRPLPFN